MAELIQRGAEALLTRGEWFGARAVYKTRLPKGYRHPELDTTLRRRRTLREAALLHRAKLAGVPTPTILFVDPERAEIVMEYIEGRRAKEVLEEGGHDAEWVAREMGRHLARLHRAQIIHGDPTTSNFIVSGRRLVLLDFGLAFHSSRLEDRAVDLHLVKEIFTSAHATRASHLFELVLAGYGAVAGEGEVRALARQIEDIERRGRYASV